MAFYNKGGSAGGGTDLSAAQLQALQTAGRWQRYDTDPTGVAVPVGKELAFFDSKLFAPDGDGNWAPQADQNATYERRTGSAPVGLPAGLPSGADAESGDVALLEYDDVELRLEVVAGSWVERHREPKGSGSSGVAPLAKRSKGQLLQPPAAPFHTQPYVVDSSGTSDGSDAALGSPDTFIDVTINPPAALTDRLQITRDGEHAIRLSGLINGDATGVYHNEDGRTLTLYVPGTLAQGWRTTY